MLNLHLQTPALIFQTLQIRQVFCIILPSAEQKELNVCIFVFKCSIYVIYI